ncbi:MAG: hypothetical protein HQL96_05115 [Magnetococcales bacterium]|nr:hypothetical protein [Magnetococcales bacterium]
MGAGTDTLKNKINMLQTEPMVYDEFLARLELDGLPQSDPMDETQKRLVHGVLDYFYDKIWLERRSLF